MRRVFVLAIAAMAVSIVFSERRRHSGRRTR